MIFMHECFMSSVFDLLHSGFVSHLCIKQFVFQHIFFSLDLLCILQRSDLFLMLALQICFDLLISAVFFCLCSLTAIVYYIVVILLVMLRQIILCLCDQLFNFFLVVCFYLFRIFQLFFAVFNDLISLCCG